MAKKQRTIIYFSGRVVSEKLAELIYGNAGFSLRGLKHYAGEVEPNFDFVGGIIPEPYKKAGIKVSPLQDEILEAMGLGGSATPNRDNPTPNPEKSLEGGAQGQNGADNGDVDDEEEGENDPNPDNADSEGPDGDDTGDDSESGDEESEDSPEEVTPAKTRKVKRTKK